MLEKINEFVQSQKVKIIADSIYFENEKVADFTIPDHTLRQRFIEAITVDNTDTLCDIHDTGYDKGYSRGFDEGVSQGEENKDA